MLRKRVIFCLIYSDGAFMQSRNFRLQRVGDINWLEKNYQFQKISFTLDELVVIDASRKERDKKRFAQCVSRLADKVFIPLVAGGGISNLKDAKRLFEHGADKVLLNSALHDAPDLVESIAANYGSQSIVAALDYQVVDGEQRVFVNNGDFMESGNLTQHITRVQVLPVGEILIQSMAQDGTGFGYDLATIENLSPIIKKPLLVAGGAGNSAHFLKAFEIKNVAGVVTANLFNFINDGLPKARADLLAAGVNLARWDYQKLSETLPSD